VAAARLTVLMLLAGCATLPAAVAQAQVVTPGAPEARVIRTIEIPMTLSGMLAVEFRAAPDTGCPAPCDLTGAVTWSPVTRGALIVYEYRIGKERQLTALVVLLPDEDRASTTARVVRALPGGGHSTCIDARGEDLATLDFSAGRNDALMARLLGGPGGAGPGTDLVGSRCDGPTGTDLATLLPQHQLTREVLLRGRVALDFSAERHFVAHGFGGVLRSSVKMALGPATVDSDPEGDLDAVEGGPSGIRTRRVPELTATYAIERAAGSVVTSFAGAREPVLCGGLGSCGAAGTVEITTVPVGGEVSVVATGTRKSTRRQLAAALGLRRGPVPRGVEVFAIGFWDEDSGSVVTAIRDADGPVCAERAGLGGGSLRFGFGRRRVSAIFGEAGSFQHDPFSSRCAGPTLGDAGGSAGLAAGTLRLADFRRKRVTVPLSRGRGFASEAYEGSSRSSLSFVLRRTRVESGVFIDFVDPRQVSIGVVSGQ
jgi:hypothetical protein